MVRETLSLLNTITVKVPISDNEPNVLVDKTIAQLYANLNVEKNTVSFSIELIDELLCNSNKDVLQLGYDELKNAVNVKLIERNFPMKF